jgi:chromosome partitioning protein
MQVVIVNSQKGGSGKSAVCRLLSVEASRRGRSVYLIDFDSETHTLTDWHEARVCEEPRRVEVSLTDIKQGLRLLAERGAELVLIDTPPNAVHEMAEIFPQADLVIVPIKPTPDDLKGAAVTVAHLKASGAPFLFVITQAIPNANITAQAVAALSHHGRVAETLLAHRVAYPESFTDGRTPQEIAPKSPAAREIAKLWDNVEACLHAGMTEERTTAHG